MKKRERKRERDTVDSFYFYLRKMHFSNWIYIKKILFIDDDK